MGKSTSKSSWQEAYEEGVKGLEEIRSKERGLREKEEIIR